MSSDAISRRRATVTAIAAAEEAAGQWSVKRDVQIEKALKELPSLGEEAQI